MDGELAGLITELRAVLPALDSGQLRVYTPNMTTQPLGDLPSTPATARAQAQACVCYNTRKVARAVTRLYDDLLRPSGLRATQLTLLMVVEALGEPAITELAEQLVMDRTTLARDLRPMEAAGWVTVTPGADRRTRIVRLTPAGGIALRAALPLWRAAQATLVDRGVGEAEWARLRGDLARLVTLAQR
jgi:DNA-binding MarR family transcriptional regulator